MNIFCSARSGEAAVRRSTLVQVVLDLLRHQLNCETGFPKVMAAKLTSSPSVWVVENMNDVDAQSVTLLLSVMQNVRSDCACSLYTDIT